VDRAGSLAGTVLSSRATPEQVRLVVDVEGVGEVDAVALRRSALVVDADGPVRARVESARVTPEQVRLVVDVDGVGEADAVAPLDSHPGVGQRVRVAVDPGRLAVWVTDPAAS
jgi:thiamine transport system ATP-binding protein